MIRDTTRKGGKSDRSARDRKRHFEKVREAIRKNIPDIISEESIIGKDKDRIIKVPIKGIKEPRFVYGPNNPGVGQGKGDGSTQPGKPVGQGQDQGHGHEHGPGGDQPGTDYYETEVSIEELIDLMFEDLNLPNQAKKKLKEIEVETTTKRKGVRNRGPRNKLLKKKTAEEHVRSVQKNKKGIVQIQEEIKSLRENGKDAEADALQANLDKKRKELEEIRIKHGLDPKPGWTPLKTEDLRYARITTDIKKESNAVVFCIMDVSGSMDTEKKYLARSFFFLLYTFLTTKYRNVEIVFISHHTEAQEVTEEDFFHKGESGGTYISSGYLKALEIIKERYHPDLWNIYVFHCSDGDNFDSDNVTAIQAARELCNVSNLFGYGEIKPHSSYAGSSMVRLFGENLRFDNFQSVLITRKENLWEKFKEFLSHDKLKEVV